MVPIDDDKKKTRHNKQREEDINHCHPRMDEMEKIDREQARSQRRTSGRTQESARKEIQKRHGSRAGKHDGNPPTERSPAERADSKTDQQLAQRRVWTDCIQRNSTNLP